MKYIHLLLVVLFINVDGFGQNFSSQDPVYIENVTAGEAKFNTMDYDSCVSYYELAFEVKQTSYLSLMRGAACAYSSENSGLMAKWMDKAYENSWGGAKNVFENYPEFDYLRASEFSEIVESKYRTAAEAAGVNLLLMAEFDHIREYDQKWRMLMRDTSEAYGWDSKQMGALWKEQSYWDSINTIRIEEVIAEYGYPGRSLVGDGHSSTAFLVIQHAPLEVQKRHIGLIKEAADAGEVRWASIALLIDRVNLRQGNKQVYGSQVAMNEETGAHYFSPMESPYQIDSIRATVGLGPIQAYADNWNFTFDVEEHLKIWKELEEKGEE